MKKYVRVKCAIAAALMVFSAVVLASCKKNENEPPLNTTEPQNTNAQYKVNVVDSRGNPYNDAIVSIMQNGALVTMLPANNGLAVFDLKKDNYTVELGFYDSNASFYYDSGECTLTGDKTETTVKLYSKPTDYEEIYAFGSNDEHKAYKAYVLHEGESYVELSANERTYFLYAPEKGGVYKFGCSSLGKAQTVGYYGSTYYVLKDNTASRDGDFVTLEFHQSMVGGVMVLGVDSSNAVDGIITLERTGDYDGGYEYAPWTAVTEEGVVDFFENAINRKYNGFKYLDLGDKNLKVLLNPSDGYYHLGTLDGPIVYITLDRQTKYLQSSLKEICELQIFGVTFFDEDGNFLRKESYAELFDQYSFGTVPMTEKLANAIKNVGEHGRWWDFDWEGNIFGADADFVVRENAWLLVCGTFEGYEEIPDVGTKNNPIKLSDEDTEKTKLFVNGSSIYAEIDKSASRLLTVEGINSGIKIIYNGNEYKTTGSSLIIELVSGVKSFEIVPDANSTGDYITLQISVKQS